MTEHELFQKTFSTLHASPDTLMEVQKTMENSKKTHRTLRKGVVIAIAAALILADKTDVRRSRVRNPDPASFDIHDRVNYSVKKAQLKINEEHTIIKLKLTVDTHYSSVMDYFEIFLGRMTMCRRAAESLGLQFKLIINEQPLM